MLSVGEPAPSFELPDQHGDPVALSEFEGGHVVVYFYPRADTRGCTIEAKGFRDNWEAFRDAGLDVVGISDDPVPDLADFAAKHDLPFRLLSDESGEVATAYDSYGKRELPDRVFEGVYRNTYVVGPEGRIVAAYEGVDPEGHAAELLDDIEG